MTTLIIDNYDSFTWNLVQLVGALGAKPVVFRHDAIDLPRIRAMRPARVILSPGPGNPIDPARVGVCRAVVDELSSELPVLGVCLGHQLIVHAHGGRIVRAKTIMHGKTSLIHHDGDDLFSGLPRPFEAMRYHSLVADPSALPATLSVTAWCADGTIMAVRDRERPLFGVQFHPESIGTPTGFLLMSAFLNVSGASVTS